MNAPEPLFSTRLRHRSKQNIVFQNIYIKMPDDDRGLLPRSFSTLTILDVIAGFHMAFLNQAQKKRCETVIFSALALSTKLIWLYTLFV